MKFGRIISAVLALACSAFMAVPVANAADDTEISTDTWVFEGIILNDWLSSNIFFEHGEKNEDGTFGGTTVTKEGITVQDFLVNIAGVEEKDIPSFAGEGEVNFAIVIIEDKANESIKSIWIEKPEEVVTLATGEFEADAEIDESEYLEIGSSDFDIE